MEHKSDFAIGIDLGTTFSCVGVWRNNSVEILANSQGNRTTPSYVGFTESDVLVGDAARNQAASNPQNTIFDVKRLLGRAFSDPVVQEDMKLWPFSVVRHAEREDAPAIQLQGTIKHPHRIIAPEEVSSIVLGYMKKTAEDNLGRAVTNAVITVPAYFNDTQRTATITAGRLAGLNVLRIINEPTAAAIAYGMDKAANKDPAKTTNVLIFDLGGGTFDVSLLSIHNGIFEVKATSGHTHLGGEDFDSALVRYCVDEYQRKFRKDISENPKALRRLRTACQRAKHALSSTLQTTIEVEALEGNDFQIQISKAKFEALCGSYFKQLEDPLNRVLLDARMDKKQVDEIVMVGGSTRIPKVQEAVRKFFDGKQLNNSINPDEAVAYGAAVQAALLSGNGTAAIENVLLLDVTPLSLGIETAGGIMAHIIPRNTPVPATRTHCFSTYYDNQEEVLIQVFEGERVRTADNEKLAEFALRDIPRLPRGQPKINVTFHVDQNGVLHVSAKEMTSDKAYEVVVVNNREGLSAREVQERLAEAKLYAARDMGELKRQEALSHFNNWVCQAQSHMRQQLDTNAKLRSAMTAEEEEAFFHQLTEAAEFHRKELALADADSKAAEPGRIMSELDDIKMKLDDIMADVSSRLEGGTAVEGSATAAADVAPEADDLD